MSVRRAGITGDIIIMTPEMSTCSTLFEYNLQPEVYSFGLLEALIKAAEKEGVTNFPIHIKLDTGMHRLGFNPETDMQALINRLQHQDALIPRSVFSHFVGSDSADFDEFSAHQFELFDKGSSELQNALPGRIIRHICNSAAIERFPERHLDMVRLGLGLYGIDPIDNRKLHNVTTLKTTILQIRDVPAGDSVGYSRKTKCPKTLPNIIHRLIRWVQHVGCIKTVISQFVFQNFIGREIRDMTINLAQPLCCQQENSLTRVRLCVTKFGIPVRTHTKHDF